MLTSLSLGVTYCLIRSSLLSYQRTDNPNKQTGGKNQETYFADFQHEFFKKKWQCLVREQAGRQHRLRKNLL
jgi:hypothetical protein